MPELEARISGVCCVARKLVGHRLLVLLQFRRRSRLFKVTG